MIFKVIVMVIKSLNDEYSYFGSKEAFRIPIIEADNKKEVKDYLVKKHPEFFPKGKVYQRETKDQAQFFYTLIYPLYKYEIDLIEEGEWKCAYCGEIHENKYISKPITSSRILGNDVYFCKSDDNHCKNMFIMKKYNISGEMADNMHYITDKSPNYIYKITEKETRKCYIGKTCNAPFFRWWDHLTKNFTKFGHHLRETKLSDWTFEVLEELPCEIKDKDVFKVESDYILKFDSINNGFNSLISNNQNNEKPEA